MSRVDDALARARRNGAGSSPVDHPPVVGGIVPGSGAEWSEEDSLPAPEADALQPPADDSDGAAVESVAGGSQSYAQEHIEGHRDLGHLRSEKLITALNADAGAIEQFRRLAAQLYLSQTQRGTRIVMVASALPGEGKTLTAANLALTLSESYRRQVLLVDGDLRRPCAHQLFQIPNLTGLNDGIRAEVERKVPLIRISPHLTLLTAGRPDSDPMSVLSSERMQRVLEEARERFEWVIIDTPPLGVLTDANLLAAMVDAAVLVVRAGRTPAAAVLRVIEAIGRDRIAGVVLNRVAPETLVPEYAGYYDAVDLGA